MSSGGSRNYCSYRFVSQCALLFRCNRSSLFYQNFSKRTGVRRRADVPERDVLVDQNLPVNGAPSVAESIVFTVKLSVLKARIEKSVPIVRFSRSGGRRVSKAGIGSNHALNCISLQPQKPAPTIGFDEAQSFDHGLQLSN